MFEREKAPWTGQIMDDGRSQHLGCASIIGDPFRVKGSGMSAVAFVFLLSSRREHYNGVELVLEAMGKSSDCVSDGPNTGTPLDSGKAITECIGDLLIREQNEVSRQNKTGVRYTGKRCSKFCAIILTQLDAIVFALEALFGVGTACFTTVDCARLGCTEYTIGTLAICLYR